jgi:hypothetical protein
VNRTVSRMVFTASVVLAASVWPAMAKENTNLEATSTMAEMMRRLVTPASNAVFAVASEAPASDEAWRDLEDKALMLAESANLLLIPGYVRPDARWLQDTVMMKEAALAAFEAAKNRNVAVLEELGNTLYESCESCHTATR